MTDLSAIQTYGLFVDLFIVLDNVRCWALENQCQVLGLVL